MNSLCDGIGPLLADLRAADISLTVANSTLELWHGAFSPLSSLIRPPTLCMLQQWTSCGRHRVSDLTALHVTFVCTSNIYRSPIAEKMFAEQLRRYSHRDAMRVTSAGTGNRHVSDGTDALVTRVLRAHGYPTNHCTTQVNADHLSADLVVSLGRNQVVMLRQLGVENSRIRMLRSFDPSSGAYALDVEDPDCGEYDDFEEIFAIIETALPGLHDWLDERFAQNGHS